MDRGEVALAPQLEAEVNRETMVIVSSLKYLSSCFYDHEGSYEDVT